MELKKMFESLCFKRARRRKGRMAIAQGQRFRLDELVAATGKFRKGCLLGEGGFGKVYKGHLESYNKVVAIKQLDRNGGTDEFIDQVGSFSRSMDHPNYLNLYGYCVKRDRRAIGNDEFVEQVASLSRSVDHPNLVKLYGYCVERDQRLLVNEYMPLGSLESHLHDLPPSRKGLDWNTRMKIAAGVAKGLEYLHVTLQQPYREFKCSRILLGEDYNPKLSDFGLRKLMGTATDYVGGRNEYRIKLDIYLFGVLLLELLTGRKPYDPVTNQHLLNWARPLMFDRKKFTAIADPKLEGRYPLKGLYGAIAAAGMCVQQDPDVRPVISELVTALNYLASQQLPQPKSSQSLNPGKLRVGVSRDAALV